MVTEKLHQAARRIIQLNKRSKEIDSEKRSLKRLFHEPFNDPSIHILEGKNMES